MLRTTSCWSASCLWALSAAMTSLPLPSHRASSSSSCRICLARSRRTMRWSSRSLTPSSSSYSLVPLATWYCIRLRWFPSCLSCSQTRTRTFASSSMPFSTTSRFMTRTGSRRSRPSVSRFTTRCTCKSWRSLIRKIPCKKWTPCTTCTTTTRPSSSTSRTTERTTASWRMRWTDSIQTRT